MASVPRPLATVPWIQEFERTFYRDELRRIFGDRSLNHDRYFETHRKIPLFEMLNKTFPYYLPIAHHQMSAFKLAKEYPAGQYWGAAIHYLISTRGHGFPQWKLYQDQYVNEEIHPFVTEKTKSMLLPANFRQCGDAKEFLFEPWVLIQLPMQPDILLQWLLAAFFEVACYAKEMSIFYLIQFPYVKRNAKILGSFQYTVERVRSCIEAGFQQLQEFVNKDMKLTKWEINTFSYKIEPLLVFLDFRLNRNGKSAIGALKRICYNTASGNKNYWKLSSPYEARRRLKSCMFNLFPQREGNRQNFIFWDLEALKRSTEESRSAQDRQLEEGQNLEDHDLFPYFQKFLYTCCGKSTYDKTHFSQPSAVQALYSVFQDCVSFHDISACLGEERGILGIILEAETKLRIIDAEIEIVKNGGNYELRQEHFDGLPKMTLREISLCQKKAKEVAYTRSIYTHMIPHMKKEVDNAYFAASPYHWADFLEKKIRKVVLDRIKKSNDRNMLLDWLFPQYMLPCFVAFYIELDAQVDNRQFVDWYAEFVLELISTYEWEQYDIVITAVEQEINTHLALFMKHHLSSHALLLSYMRKVSTALTGIFSSDEQVKQLSKFPLFQSFFEALEYGNRTKFPERSNEKIAHETNKIWDVLTFDFFLRIESSLIKTLGMPHQFYSICKWTPNVVDLIRTLLLFIQPIESNYLFYLELTSSSQLLYDIFKHILRCTAEELEGLIQEIGKLTEAQILGIAFHLAMTNVSPENVLSKMEKVNEFIDVRSLRPSCGDVDIAFHSFLTDVNMWRLKEFYAANLGEEAKVSRDHLTKIAPTCFSLLNNKPIYKNLWFYPTRVCRGCWLEDEEKLSMCNICEYSGFPDKHFFCSVACATNIMKLRHRNEHFTYDKLADYFLP